MIPYCDQDAFSAMVEALKATGAFAEVSFGVTIDRCNISAGCLPLALIVPTEWTERDTPDSGSLMRQVGFTLTLVVRQADEAARFEQLDRLASLAHGVMNRSDLGGGCVRALTKIRRARHDQGTRHPEQRIVLNGDFSYLIPEG
ncbi:MAG: hypothetical protein ABI353_18815 [Isosphaeraceae bacterium]